MQKLTKAIAFCLLASLFASCTNVTTDKSLKNSFEVHQPEFEALRDMIVREDKINLPKIAEKTIDDFEIGEDRVANFYPTSNGWLEIADAERHIYSKEEMLKTSGLSPEKYNLYLKMLKSVGAVRIGRTRSKGKTEVRFMMQCVGIQDNGGCKYIVYTDHSPESLTEDTDQILKTGAFEGTCYSKIKDDWYIALEWSK